MHPYMERLKEELEKNPPNYGYPDADSILDMLHMWYAQWNPVNSDQIKEDFLKLESLFFANKNVKTDDMMDIITRLCWNHEHLAFLEGLRVGIRLAQEL